MLDFVVRLTIFGVVTHVHGPLTCSSYTTEQSTGTVSHRNTTTNSTRSMALDRPCRLLALPAELREQIWILVVDPGDPTSHQPEPALMCASRYTRAETLPIYYARYTLLISTYLHTSTRSQHNLPPYTSDSTRDHHCIEPRKLERITRFRLSYKTYSGVGSLDYDITLNKSDDGYSLHSATEGVDQWSCSMTQDKLAYFTDLETALHSLLSARLSAFTIDGRMSRGNVDAATLTALTRIRKGVLPRPETPY